MALLTDEKQTHLAHVILEFLKKQSGGRAITNATEALREIKRVLTAQVAAEQEIDRLVRKRLASYSRPIPEGSPEWDVLYQKAYSEELRIRRLG